jgi:glycosyltransferase involved in cell wall biosynthesis
LLPISLLIPVYGRQELFDQAVASVLCQTRLPAELVIVDDGSPEPIRLGEGVARSGLQVNLVRHPVNRGVAAARNTAMQIARSDWISFLDSDDRLTPDSLEFRWSKIENTHVNGSLVAYGCGWIEDDPVRTAGRMRMPRPASSIRSFASGSWFSPGSCLLLPRQPLVQNGLFQDEALLRFEDYDWFLQLSLAGYSLRILDAYGVRIRRSRNANAQTNEKMARMILDKWGGGQLETEAYRRLRGYMMLECAASNFHAGNPARSAGFFSPQFRGGSQVVATFFARLAG